MKNKKIPKFKRINEYISETEAEREKNALQFIINYINRRIAEEENTISKN
jgi:hypothetical protein